MLNKLELESFGQQKVLALALAHLGDQVYEEAKKTKEECCVLDFEVERENVQKY